jgi:hypothetical protein
MFWELIVQHVSDETAETHVEALWLLKADAKDRIKRKTVTLPAQEDLVKARKNGSRWWHWPCSRLISGTSTGRKLLTMLNMSR